MNGLNPINTDYKDKEVPMESYTPNQAGVILHFPTLPQMSPGISHDFNELPEASRKQNEIKPLTTASNEKILKGKLDNYYQDYTLIGEKEKSLTIAFIVGIGLGLIVLGISASLLVFEATVIGGAVLFFSLFSMIVYGLSIFVVKKNKRIIDEVVGIRDDPEIISQSKERMLLYICCYCLMLIFLFYLVMATSFCIYRSNLFMRIRGIGYDKKQWEKSFKDETFDEVINRFTIMLNALAAISYIYSIYTFIIVLMILIMIKSYRTWKLVIHFICLIFFQLSFVFIHYGTNGIKFQNVTGIEEQMPGWVTYGLFAIGIVILFIALFAFVIIFFEHKRLLVAYTIMSVILCIILILLNVGGTFINTKFKGYQEADCNQLFNYLDRDYLKKHLCNDKYLFTTNEIDGLQCPKYRVVLAWEIDEAKPEGNEVNTYGCISQRCCLATYSFVKEKYDFLILLSYVLMLISMLLIFCSWYLIRNVDKYYDEGIRDNFIFYFIGGAAILVFLIMIPFIGTIPNAPKSSKLSQLESLEARQERSVAKSESIIPVGADVYKSENNQLMKNTIDWVSEKNQHSITYQNTRASTNLAIGTLEITMTTTNGIIIPNPSNPFDTIIKLNKNESISEEKGEYTVVLDATEPNQINNYFKYILVKPICEVAKVTVVVSIKGTVIEVAESDPGEIISEQTERAQPLKELVIILKGKKVGDIVDIITDESIDFSLVKVDKEIKLQAQIFDKIDTELIVYPIHNINCSAFIEKTFTEQTGKVVITLYEHKTQIPLYYNITMKPKEVNTQLGTYQTQIILGGLSSISRSTNLGLITYTTKEGGKAKVFGEAVNAFGNLPVDDIEVQIYNELIYLNPSESNPGNQKQFTKATRTTKKGEFNLDELSPGQYTLLLTNPRFYIENIVITLSEGEKLDLGKIGMAEVKEHGELSFVLSWPDGPVDLDLQSNFAVSNDKYCTVSFTNYKCVETRIEGMNHYGGKNGVETITIRNMGDYKYMFYVHKYIDTSNDIAKGEKRIDGLEFVHFPKDTSKIPNTVLSQSKAVIKVYGPGYRTPIITIPIPEDDSKYDDNKYTYWIAFCVDGSVGISSYKIVNQFSIDEPKKDFCKSFYQ